MLSSLSDILEGTENAKSFEVKNGRNQRVFRSRCVKSKACRRVPESEAFGTSITIQSEISRGRFPVGRTKDVNTAGRFDMSSGPGKVIPNSIVNPNPSGRIMSSGHFVIEIIQTWMQERKNIERPVKPTSHLLPMLQLVIRFHAVNRFNGPSVEGVANIGTMFRGKSQCHLIGIHVDADDWDNRSKDLLFELVGD
jgi:hypothetical protein